MIVGATGRAAATGPDIPADIDIRDLDREVRAELRSLPKGAADTVGRHLVAAGRFLDDDPELALQHAQAARAQAGRIASVREAVGLAAYHAGEWKLAIAELRAWRRFTGSDAHLPLVADSERALGRPEKAVQLVEEAELDRLDTETRIELLIVASGAKHDQGDVEGAISTLRLPELRSNSNAQWVARLRYAYAEMLLAAGQRDDAREWFVLAADADPGGETDAGERVLDLDGVLFSDDDLIIDDEAEDDLDDQDDLAAGDLADDDLYEDDDLDDLDDGEILDSVDDEIIGEDDDSEADAFADEVLASTDTAVVGAATTAAEAGTDADATGSDAGASQAADQQDRGAGTGEADAGEAGAGEDGTSGR